MTRRRNEKLQLWIAWITLTQAIVGTVAVSVLWAAPQRSPIPIGPTPIEIEQQAQHDRLTVIADQVLSLNALRIDARLSVLEKAAERSDKMEMLMYGIIATMIGNLMLTIVGIRNRPDKRAVEE